MALVIYRSPVNLRDDLDPAAIFEDLFASKSWKDSWRDGVYDFLHFHTNRHELLGIARGAVQVEFGGAKGKRLRLRAGDGCSFCRDGPSAHRRQRRPPGCRRLSTKFRRLRRAEAFRYGPSKGGRGRRPRARPKSDPVDGGKGPLLVHWR
jgi:hypothetical protein